MSEYTMGAVEMRFAEIMGAYRFRIELRPTICPEGSENGTVTSLMSRQMFQARQSEVIIEESFAGSLPAFVAAFTSRKKLSTKEIKELKKIIENNGGEKE